MSNSDEKSLYERLGGYDAVSAVANNLLPRLMADQLLGRFWKNRGDDGIAREKQLLIDFLCASAGGPMYYTGRDMKLVHKGMRSNYPPAEPGALFSVSRSKRLEGDADASPAHCAT